MIKKRLVGEVMGWEEGFEVQEYEGKQQTKADGLHGAHGD